MRALQLLGYGDNSQLALNDVDRPEPAAGEVLIKVEYAGMNPVDFKTRDGVLKTILPYQLPQTMGQEVAGTVEACGPGVDRFGIGDRVFARLAKERMGGFADYVVSDARLLARIPDNLESEVAAGVPLVALTAWQCLHEYGRIGPGSKVLIHAGAGAVGRVAIQVAKNAGAQVATTVSERGEALARELGADLLINYRTQRFEDAVSDYDFVLDTVAGDTLRRSYKVLRRGGKLCTISATPEARTARDLGKGPVATGLYASLFALLSAPWTLRGLLAGVDYRFVFMRPDGEQLSAIAKEAEAGRLRFDIGDVVPLDEYERGFDALENETAFGKLVLKI
ncbi:MAG: NADP-dependent oxidoreductase [Pseudomonadota bacterium]